MARKGRKPLATGHVERLSGSELAKLRLTTLLQTLRGELTVPEACARLEIGESRFHALRNQWLQEALELLEPRPLGRPRQATAATDNPPWQAGRARWGATVLRNPTLALRQPATEASSVG